MIYLLFTLDVTIQDFHNFALEFWGEKTRQKGALQSKTPVLLHVRRHIRFEINKSTDHVRTKCKLPIF